MFGLRDGSLEVADDGFPGGDVGAAFASFLGYHAVMGGGDVSSQTIVPRKAKVHRSTLGQNN